MKAVQINQTGGPEVLNWTEVPDPLPGPDDVLVSVAAAGLNFIDTYQRTGLYPVRMPFTPGLEGAGVITEVGAEVTGLNVGDTVAWSSALGTYAEKVVVPARVAVPVPDGVDSEIAAAVMLQGMTAHYLVTDTFPLAKGDRCLIHAGAGGVGLLLIQMAKMIGAEVFTTVGTPEKAELARGAGADHVILYREVDFGDEVEAIAGVRALDVVYDGVGKSVFTRSLSLLRSRHDGHVRQRLGTSGAVEPARSGTVIVPHPAQPLPIHRNPRGSAASERRRLQLDRSRKSRRPNRRPGSNAGSRRSPQDARGPPDHRQGDLDPLT